MLIHKLLRQSLNKCRGTAASPSLSLLPCPPYLSLSLVVFSLGLVRVSRQTCHALLAYLITAVAGHTALFPGGTVKLIFSGGEYESGRIAGMMGEVRMDDRGLCVRVLLIIEVPARGQKGKR